MPEATNLSAIEPNGDKQWRPLAAPDQSRFLCINADFDACNWFVPAGTADAFCLACRHNGTVPDFANSPANLASWQNIEIAKHRLFYALIRWNLPLRTVAQDPAHGLVFEFLADPPAANVPKVLTGHDEGKITIALLEADDAEREKRRQAMGEPYRTLLGHFRHEVGHHYWDVLIRDQCKVDGCRAVFGDDSMDYEEALKQHYVNGAPSDWQNNFVSAYATTHPWEDFAETWAHYLHIVDTLEMVSASGMSVRPIVDSTGDHSARVDFDPYLAGTMQQIVDAWLPFVFAINGVSRAMGERDVYPFVLSPPVVNKLGYIHALIHGQA